MTSKLFVFCTVIFITLFTSHAIWRISICYMHCTILNIKHRSKLDIIRLLLYQTFCLKDTSIITQLHIDHSFRTLNAINIHLVKLYRKMNCLLTGINIQKTLYELSIHQAGTFCLILGRPKSWILILLFYLTCHRLISRCTHLTPAQTKIWEPFVNRHPRWLTRQYTKHVLLLW